MEQMDVDNSNQEESRADVLTPTGDGDPSHLVGGRARKPTTFADYETNPLAAKVFRQKVGVKSESKAKVKPVAGKRAKGEKLAVSVPAKKGKANSSSSAKTSKLKKLQNIPSSKSIYPEFLSQAKEKAWNEAEEGCIARAKNLQAEKEEKLRARPKDLPSGHFSLKSVGDALRESVVQNTNVVLDWELEAVKMVGHLCKVYWDGEDTWFYARVLNYDANHKMHYIYYSEDQTAEWIDFEKEAVLVATDMLMARASKNTSLWPGVRYWTSSLAKVQLQKTPGYLSDGVYIEYFDDKFLNEYGFVHEQHLLPIQEQYYPKKPARKFLNALESAKVEHALVNQIVEDLKKALIDSYFKYLFGNDWIGMKVRVETHAIVRKEISKKGNLTDISEYEEPETVKCIGFIAQHCPSINQYLVIFEQRELHPQWIVLDKAVVEVIPERHTNIEMNQIMSVSTAATSSEERTEALIDDPVSTIAPRVMPSLFCCLLCHRVPVALDLVLKCSQCKAICHETCAPSEDLVQPINLESNGKGLKQPFKWKCWNCKACQNCGTTLWDRPLINWNIRRKFPRSSTEKSFLLCGICLHSYKHSQDYCTICFRLYSNNVGCGAPMLSCDAAKSSNDQPPTEGKILSPLDVSAITEDKVATEVFDEKSMIQCNECEGWIHATCEGIDPLQYQSITEGTHPIWGDEYLCPMCRVDLCLRFIEDLTKLDDLYLFAEPVTEAVASNYFDIIRSPMDLMTIRGRNERGQYKSLQPFRHDVELMCCNALIFNRIGDEVWRYTFKYFNAVEEMFNSNLHRTQLTAYGLEALEILNKAKSSMPALFEVQSARGSGKKRKSEGVVFDAIKEIDQKTVKKVKTHKGEENTISEEMTDVAELCREDVELRSDNEEDLESSEPGEPDDRPEELPVVSIELQPLHEPSSFIQPFFTMQSAEDAFYSVALDACLVCGSAGASSHFLFCVDCGEAFHDFCCNAPRSMSDDARRSWRCPNCKICVICGLVSEGDGDNMLLCEACDDAFHITCLQPPLPTVDNGRQHNAWYCSQCVSCTCCSLRKVKPRGKEEPSYQTQNSVISWGYLATLCYPCSLLSSTEQRSRRQCHYLCDFPESVPVFECSECDKIFHFECANDENKNWKFIEFYRYPLCKGCHSMKLPHHSQFDRKLQLAEEISEIQFQRKRKIENQESQMGSLLQSSLDQMISENVYTCLIMTIWGGVRKLLFEENKRCTESVVNHRSMILPDSNLVFMPAKARRYVNYMRRHKSLANRPVPSPSPSTETTLSRQALLTLANLSSYFTFVSDLEGVNLRHGLTEIVIVIFEVGLLLFKKYFSVLSTLSAEPTGEGNNMAVEENAVVLRLENIVLKIYASIGIPQTSVLSAGRPYSKFGHFVPSRNENGSSGRDMAAVEGNLHQAMRSLQLLYRADVHVVESYIVENFKELSQQEKLDVSSFFNLMFGRWALPTAEKEDGKTMHKMLERFQAARKNLICKSANIYVAPPLPSVAQDVKEFRPLVGKMLRDKLKGQSLLHLSGHASSLNLKEGEVLISGSPSISDISNGRRLLKILAEVKEQLTRDYDVPDATTIFDSLNLDTIFRDYCDQFLGCEETVDAIDLPSADKDSSEVLCTQSSRSRAERMIGWKIEEQQSLSIASVAKQQKWMDFRCCLFCMKQSEDDLHGRLLPFPDGALAHANCLLWCSEVEVVGGQVVNAEDARLRCSQQTCYFCLKRGATIGCCRGNGLRRCKRTYHLQCAISSKCLLLRMNPTHRSLQVADPTALEAQETVNPKTAEFVAICPEHLIEKRTLVVEDQYDVWVPEDPDRCLVVETCATRLEMENIAKVLAQQRTDIAVKSGAVTILKIGSPAIDKPYFSNKYVLYPHHFTSTRIFWSMISANHRTVYFFEVLDRSDIEQWDASQMSYLRKSLLKLQHFGTERFECDDLLAGPIFRVVALDSMDSPIFGKTVSQLHRHILHRVAEMNQGSHLTRKVRQSYHSYNLTPHQFFGLGLPCVTEAIELIPSSILSMITLSTADRYCPYYHLPSHKEIQNIVKYQSSLQSNTQSHSLNGCTRADPYLSRSSHENVAVRISSAKTAGTDPLCGEASSGGTDTADSDEYFVDLNKENSKAEIENRKIRFLDMTRSYLRNPYAKLEVKKSRIHGWGLFSKINYEKDDVIVEYIGEKIRQPIADRRELNYELEGVGSCYLFRLDKDDIVDATKIGGMSRFMNHCCEPNAYARIIEYEDAETKAIEKHIVIMAAKNIQEGEEITYDYKFPIEDGKLKCYCGAPRCSGSMN